MIYKHGKISLSDVKADPHNEGLRGILANTSLDSGSEGLFVQRVSGKSNSKCGGGRSISRSKPRGHDMIGFVIIVKCPSI